jgi:hypothetical protein
MIWPQRIVLLLVGLMLLGITLELIRRRRLREEYAVLWVCTGLMFLVAVVMADAVRSVTDWLHTSVAGMVALTGFLFLSAIVLHYSVVISRLSDREKTLAQDVALLRDELEKLRSHVREGPPAPPEPKPKPPSLRT